MKLVSLSDNFLFRFGLQVSLRVVVDFVSHERPSQHEDLPRHRDGRFLLTRLLAGVKFDRKSHDSTDCIEASTKRTRPGLCEVLSDPAW